MLTMDSASKRIKMNLIVAACNNYGIGKSGGFPWPRLSKELKHFKMLTCRTVDPDKRNAVVLGRKTWESIPEDRVPLADRLNVIISRTLTADDVPEDVHVYSSFDAAIRFLSQCARIETIWNIGGADIYQLGMAHPLLHRVYLTRILGNFECDAFFPGEKLTEMKLVSDPDMPDGIQEENGIHYKYETYEISKNPSLTLQSSLRNV